MRFYFTLLNQMGYNGEGREGRSRSIYTSLSKILLKKPETVTVFHVASQP